MKDGILTLEDEAFLVNIGLRMRALLLMCAPRFAETSEGAAGVEQARTSIVKLRAFAESIANANKEDKEDEK